MNFRLTPRLVLLGLLVALLAVLAAGCGREDEDSSGNEAAAETETAGSETTEELSGRIEADGSSTVGPLTTFAAESFQEEHPDVQVTVGISGTGGGFERFCAGETDLSNASRPIKDDEEAPICEESGVEYTESMSRTTLSRWSSIPRTTGLTSLTIEQLKTIWEPDSKIDNWNQIDPSFPDQPLKLFGAGTDSGTFDYFTEAIVGEEGASRSDYSATEDDNVTVQGVSGDKGALGYFGFSYFDENQDKLKALEIDGGDGCVAPSAEAAQDGTYTPLARPLFIYAKNESFERPEVEAFVKSILDDNAAIAEGALFIPLTEEQLAEAETGYDEALASVGAG